MSDPSHPRPSEPDLAALATEDDWPALAARVRAEIQGMADATFDVYAALDAALRAANPTPEPVRDRERLLCQWCGDDLALNEIVGHLASEGREIPRIPVLTALEREIREALPDARCGPEWRTRHAPECRQQDYEEVMARVNALPALALPGEALRTACRRLIDRLADIRVGTTTGMTHYRIERIVRDADYALMALEKGDIDNALAALRRGFQRAPVVLRAVLSTETTDHE